MQPASNLTEFSAQLLNIIDRVLVPLVVAIAFIVFIWGVYQYLIAGAANEEKRSEGQKHVLWGLIGFFVIFSLWGLVNILVGTFGFEGSSKPGLPTFGERSGNNTQTESTEANPFANTQEESSSGGLQQSTRDWLNSLSAEEEEKLINDLAEQELNGTP